MEDISVWQCSKLPSEVFTPYTIEYRGKEALIRVSDSVKASKESLESFIKDYVKAHLV